MKNSIRILGIAAIVAGAASVADAKLVNAIGPASDVNGGSENGVLPEIIAAPGSVIDDAPGAENSGLQAFDEVVGYVLGANLDVDAPNPTVAAGTRVDSHMIFLNSSGGTQIEHTATFTFDGMIVGLMYDNDGVNEGASSPFLGAPGTDYPNGFNNRGFEANNPDLATILVGGKSLEVTMFVTEPGDWMRVVTISQVPLPASAWMLGLGLVGAGAYARRKQKKAA